MKGDRAARICVFSACDVSSVGAPPSYGSLLVWCPWLAFFLPGLSWFAVTDWQDRRIFVLLLSSTAVNG